MRVIRAFNQEKKEKEEFAEVTEALTRGQLFVGKISSFLNPLTYAVINLSIVALIWGGAKQVDLGILKQGQVYALVNYMSQILIELVKLANLIITETKAVACANRLGAIFETTSKPRYMRLHPWKQPAVQRFRRWSLSMQVSRMRMQRKLPSRTFPEGETWRKRSVLSVVQAPVNRLL